VPASSGGLVHRNLVLLTVVPSISLFPAAENAAIGHVARWLVTLWHQQTLAAIWRRVRSHNIIHRMPTRPGTRPPKDRRLTEHRNPVSKNLDRLSMAEWLNQERIERARATVREALDRDVVDLATLSVALRVLRGLPGVQAS